MTLSQVFVFRLSEGVVGLLSFIDDINYLLRRDEGCPLRFLVSPLTSNVRLDSGSILP